MSHVRTSLGAIPRLRSLQVLQVLMVGTDLFCYVQIWKHQYVQIWKHQQRSVSPTSPGLPRASRNDNL
jgi:hypothetical protein